MNPTDPVVGVEWLMERLKSGDGASRLFIFDVRFELSAPHAGREAYLRGHIPGAVYLDLERDLSGPVGAHGGRHPLPDIGRLAETLRQYGVRRDSVLVFYDQGSAAYAARAWWLLTWLGHPAAHVLDGGFKAWLEAGGPVSTGDADERAARSREHGDFRAEPQEGWIAGRDEVLQLSRALRSGARGAALVDARAPERYRGETEPIDRVAGHIPGAANCDYAQNFDPSGRWLSPAELRARYAAFEDLEDVVVYCGSGVSACADILGMVRAGLRRPRLYPGSWSDWISHPDAPVARGDEASPAEPR
ncbi:MAG: sulfurtransferase [Firmicutes bacterium]|nr:sulfurtransferase [Bacillota bacterium]